MRNREGGARPTRFEGGVINVLDRSADRLASDGHRAGRGRLLPHLLVERKPRAVDGHGDWPVAYWAAAQQKSISSLWTEGVVQTVSK